MTPITQQLVDFSQAQSSVLEVGLHPHAVEVFAKIKPDRTLPMVLGWGALTAVTLGVYDLTGGYIYGYKQPEEIDEFERKQKLRANKRRPIQETIDKLGEGRGLLMRASTRIIRLTFVPGIYAPGWEERRKERIKATYGIDVPGAKS